jgi:hypothetical protein
LTLIFVVKIIFGCILWFLTYHGVRKWYREIKRQDRIHGAVFRATQREQIRDGIEALIRLTKADPSAKTIQFGALFARHPDLPMPHIEPLEDGTVRLSWSSRFAYAELELNPETGNEWFVRSPFEYANSDKPLHGEPPETFVSFVVDHFGDRKGT